MACEACQHTYCFVHGDSHPASTSCAEHDVATAADRELALAVLAKHTKPCPGCRAPIEKAEGCNQVKCPRCGTNHCWICGKEVDVAVFPLHCKYCDRPVHLVADCSFLFQTNGERTFDRSLVPKHCCQ
jgi:LSD1 subclass zinc finger protein